jgi:hypothetical protein
MLRSQIWLFYFLFFIFSLDDCHIDYIKKFGKTFHQTNKPRYKGGMKPEQAMNLKGKGNTMHVAPGIKY